MKRVTTKTGERGAPGAAGRRVAGARHAGALSGGGAARSCRSTSTTTRRATTTSRSPARRPGKSLLLNEIAAAYLGTGARVWIIDVGRLYEKACRNFGGSFIEFTEDAALSLNPVPLVEDIDEDMELLQPLLAQMVSPRESLDGFQYSTLGRRSRRSGRPRAAP